MPVARVTCTIPSCESQDLVVVECQALVVGRSSSTSASASSASSSASTFALVLVFVPSQHWIAQTDNAGKCTPPQFQTDNVRVVCKRISTECVKHKKSDAGHAARGALFLCSRSSAEVTCEISMRFA